MKKTFILSLAAVAVAGALCLTSCKDSNEAAVEEYKHLVDEAAAAQKSGDIDKAMKVTQDLVKFAEDNKDREFTPEQQQEMANYAIEAVSK